MYCPVCMSINTGKIGSDTYYCSDCLLEFACNGNEITIYYIDPEGVSYALKDRREARKLVDSIRQGDELLFQETLQELTGKC